MTLTLDGINRAREAGLDDDRIISSIERRDPEMAKRFTEARTKGLDNTRILKSVERKLNTPVNTPDQETNTPAEQKETPRQLELMKSFNKGYNASVSGELQTAISEKRRDEDVKDPVFWEKLAQSGGGVAGDLPYMLAGGTLGAALGGAAGSVIPGVGNIVGGLAGGGFGALALPTFLKESLKE